MKIAVVSTFYSEGMGYTENCLPKALASLGHEVHLITSNLNVYGNSPDYDDTYKSFLGPADQGVRQYMVDGYVVRRLSSRLVAGYVSVRGLARELMQIRPNVVHSTEIASLQSFVLATLKPLLGFKYFAENHQHLSVVRPFLKDKGGFLAQRAAYRLTRTLPTYLASLSVEKCYAIAPDCIEVATKFYGVPGRKIKLQSLGTDTEMFRPASTEREMARRHDLRRQLGYVDSDIVCIYTGRFSPEKNPLMLAQVISVLSSHDPRFHALFVGAGRQGEALAGCRNAKIVPFRKHAELAELYRIADIAVWPRQESMSMLDAASSALPLVVSDTIGETDRVTGNGRTYREDDSDDLQRVLLSLSRDTDRKMLGASGRQKMIATFSWRSIARTLVADYAAAGAAA
jgi:glycosyltransferase involved in cell wall biosynthesis